MRVRTRFAPSPTGYMHLGNARTALFSYLFARHHGGEFILRIEDTDRERSTDGAIAVIFEAMSWLGLNYDEDPIYQTQRFDHYNHIIEMLLAQGLAYRCDCSKERLANLRDEQERLKRKPRYDAKCRARTDVDPTLPHVIRFKTPTTGTVKFEDQVRGLVEVENSELDDLIIRRTDGSPTYNYTVVVDDSESAITHVIRGDDHINNTLRQIHLYEALGHPVPTFAHLPMILGHDGQRLSKRHGAVNVLAYRDEGILPAAMLNYLVRLGWSHGDTEVFSIDEMINLFSLEGVRKSPACFDRDKLNWLNQHYLKETSDAILMPLYEKALADIGIQAPVTTVKAVLDLYRERAKTLTEMALLTRFFYAPVTAWPDDLIEKHFKADVMPTYESILTQFKALPTWDAASIHAVMADTIEAHAQKFGKVAQPIRIAVSGGTVSPPLDITLSLIGQAETVARMAGALALIKSAN